ncbi:putative bifunctional diguanylate cyclase/phosphodiesterase [Ideonella sp. BN130291]|uniref:putative bifunctional diguanylate cyclase/phosphodiesterase n=1 Tax=Ideonella sp. BN130291 TaxID=3112940 RepID=UPI002E27107B|nr:bifunctional diguanylate cyclase/phosphodiesterase [Ideonella sp. BN130291]
MRATPRADARAGNAPAPRTPRVDDNRAEAIRTAWQRSALLRMAAAGLVAMLVLVAVWWLDPGSLPTALVALGTVGVGLAAQAYRRVLARAAAAEANIARLTTEDEVTGLLNRNALLKALEQTIDRHRRYQGASALLYLDVDGFKRVNDLWGRQLGDRVLGALGHRLSGSLRNCDIAARLGADEFAIILTGTPLPDHAARVAGRLIASACEPVTAGEALAHVGLSVGIVMVDAGSAGAEELLRQAELAMYQAKGQGRGNCQFFSQELGDAVRKRLDTEAQLRVALRDDQFFLEFQPQVDSRSGRLCGLEALLRWRHPERGVIPPLDFIPVAEDTGLIIPIGLRVIDMACAAVATLRAEGLQPPCMAVNVSARQLDSNVPLLAELRGAIARHGLQPADLELEMTESVIMSRPDKQAPLLDAMSREGFSIAIDDFGTGYSSLSYLQSLPVDKLKIDRSFVRGLPHKRESAVIVASIASIAQSLGLATVAEGVETEAQSEHLRELGCDHLQGYLFAKPLPLPVLMAWIRERELALT